MGGSNCHVPSSDPCGECRAEHDHGAGVEGGG